MAEQACARYSVDRIEGSVAVLIADADGSSLPVPLASLPAGTAEGMLLRRTAQGGYERDAVAEQERRARVLALQNRLRRKDDR